MEAGGCLDGQRGGAVVVGRLFERAFLVRGGHRLGVAGLPIDARFFARGGKRVFERRLDGRGDALGEGVVAER